MRSGLKRCPCGSTQRPATPEDTVQPGLCLADGQVQGQSGHHGQPSRNSQDPADNLRIFAAPSPFPPCTLWEEALVAMERGQVGSQ